MMLNNKYSPRVQFLTILIYILGVTPAFSQSQEPNFFTKKDSAKASYKNKLLVVPVVALSTETNWVFGVGSFYVFKTAKHDSALRVSSLPFGFLYTLNNQILIAVGANIFLPKEKYNIRFENTFSKYPDRYWGLGNNTDGREKAYENYTFTQFYINPQIYRKVRGDFFLGVGFDFQRVFNIEYNPTGKAKSESYFDQDNVIGVIDRSSYTVFGTSFIINHDSRKHAYVPNQGELFRLRFTNFSKSFGSDYTFQQVEIDYRKFIPISRRSVLAIQSLSLFNFGDVPYRNLGVLGGNNIMRGYYLGRFRDLKFSAIQAEYRFPIKGRFGGVAFLGTGEVGNRFGDFGFDKLKIAYGTGLRVTIFKQDKLNLRFDVATNPTGAINYYILVAESF